MTDFDAWWSGYWQNKKDTYEYVISRSIARDAWEARRRTRPHVKPDAAVQAFHRIVALVPTGGRKKDFLYALADDVHEVSKSLGDPLADVHRVAVEAIPDGPMSGHYDQAVVASALHRSAEADVSAILAVIDRYENETGNIEPEDGWRLIRDLRAALGVQGEES